MKKIARVKAEKAAEVQAAIAAIDEVDKVLNVLVEKVAPYNFYIPMSEIVDNARNWSNYTSCSRQMLIAELNGCIDIINRKIELYNQKDITVRFLVGGNAGTITTLKESIAKEFSEMGIVELA